MRGLFLILLAFLLYAEEDFTETVEIALELDADALGVERRLGEVAVVGLIVGLQQGGSCHPARHVAQ